MKVPENASGSALKNEGLPTVLVIDDDAAILSALKRTLRNEPYEVLATEDPYQALDWVRSRAIDVVIADEFMPAMRGTELLEAVARYAPKSAKVVLTGYPKVVSTEAGTKEGSPLVIQKPWEDDLLRRSVRLLLESSRTQPA